MRVFHLTALGRLLDNRHALTGILLVALLLALPSLRAGYILDDLFQQLFLGAGGADAGPMPELRRAPHDLYAFFPDDENLRQAARDRGLLSWYAQPDFAASHWRPAASLLLALDNAVAPNSALWAHVHSVLWLAALVVAAGALYRTLLPTRWVAMLATLLFAIADTHAFSLTWIANRCAAVSTVFGVLAVLFHVRWRRDSSRAAAWLAPACLAVALLAGEYGVALAAYIVAYALVLEGGGVHARPSLGRRLVTVLPAAAVVLAWLMLLRGLGYASRGGSFYVDPLAEPAAWIAALPERLFLILQIQLVRLEPETFPTSAAARSALSVTAPVIVLALGALYWRLVRSAAIARFFAVGAMLAALPFTAAEPSSRFLLPLGVGAMGLAAVLLSRGHGLPDSPAPEYFRRPSVRVLVAVTVVVHLVLAPVLFVVKTDAVTAFGHAFNATALSLDRLGDLSGKTLVIVTGPSNYFMSLAAFARPLFHRSIPRRVVGLCSTHDPVTVSRADERTLLVSTPGSFFSAPLDKLQYSAARRFAPGERYVLPTGIELTIAKATRDGLPSSVECRFPRRLEEMDVVFAVWSADGYRPLPALPVGAGLDVSPVTIETLHTLALAYRASAE